MSPGCATISAAAMPLNGFAEDPFPPPDPGRHESSCRTPASPEPTVSRRRRFVRRHRRQDPSGVNLTSYAVFGVRKRTLPARHVGAIVVDANEWQRRTPPAVPATRNSTAAVASWSASPTRIPLDADRRDRGVGSNRPAYAPFDCAVRMAGRTPLPSSKTTSGATSQRRSRRTCRSTAVS